MQSFYKYDWHIVTTIASETERAYGDVLLGHSGKVKELEFNLTQEQIDHLVDVGFNRAARLGYKERYHTLHSNCVTSLFEIIDEAFPQTKKMPDLQIKMWRVLDPVLGPSIKALLARKIVVAPMKWSIFDEEVLDGRLPVLDQMLEAAENDGEREWIKQEVKSAQQKTKRSKPALAVPQS